MARSRSGRPYTMIDLLSNLTDDVKEFVDSEVIDRADALEREVRRVPGRVAGDRRGSSPRLESREIDELKNAVAELTDKVGRLVEARQARRAGPPAGNASAVTGPSGEVGTE